MSNCLQCSKPIKGLKPGAKFCSGACRTKYSRAAKAGKIAKPKKEKKAAEKPLKFFDAERIDLSTNQDEPPFFVSGREPTVMSGKEYYDKNMAMIEKLDPSIRKIDDIRIKVLSGEGIPLVEGDHKSASIAIFQPETVKKVVEEFCGQQGITPTEMIQKFWPEKKTNKKITAPEKVAEKKETKSQLSPFMLKQQRKAKGLE